MHPLAAETCLVRQCAPVTVSALVGACCLAAALPAMASESVGGPVAQAVARLDGRVADTSGQPIEGAVVTIIKLDRQAQRLLADVPMSMLGSRLAADDPDSVRLVADLKREQLYSEWVTDADGRYTAIGIYAGVQHFVRVSKEGFVAHEAGLEPRPAANTLDITLGRAGTVVAPDGPGREAIDAYERGRQAYDGGDFAAAAEAMEAAAALLEEEQRAADVYLNALTVLGQARQRLGDAAGAESAMRRVLETAPDNPYAHQFFGQQAAQSGDLEVAERHFRAYVDAVPDSANGRLNLGAVMLNRGDAAGAVVQLSRAVELAPDFAPAHLNLAIAHERAGAVEPALAAYRRVLELSPGSAAASAARQAIARLEG